MLVLPCNQMNTIPEQVRNPIEVTRGALQVEASARLDFVRLDRESTPLTGVTAHLFGVIAWFLGLLLILLLNIIVLASNYVGAKVSFILLGFDPRPLADDELLVWVFRAVAPMATLADLFALVVALALFVALFFGVRAAFQVGIVSEEDRHIPWGRIVGLVLAVIPIAVLIWWDVDLFRYRGVAGTAGIEDPDAATRLAEWEAQLRNHCGLYAWTLLKSGAAGYIAATFIACTSLEVVLLPFGRYWKKKIAV